MIEGALRLHELFSILFFYMPIFSRPMRFTLYYVKLVIVMTMGSIFAASFTLVESVIVGIFVAMCSSIPLIVYKALLNNEHAFVRYLGLFLCMCTIGLMFLMTLLNAALMDL